MLGVLRKAFWYWRNNGTRGLIHRIFLQFAIGVQPAPEVKSETNILSARFSALAPLRVSLQSASSVRRVNMVTDSLGRDSLFGGVGTSVIFAALLANRLGVQLRVVTRTDAARPENLDHILRLYGIELAHEVQFKYAGILDQAYELDIHHDDVFLTTSWWTTAATLPSVPRHSIVYLLQEDERMFYPFGDDRLRCDAVLRNPDLRFVVNTKLLFDYLVADGFDSIARHGRWFEPAFPAHVFHPRPRDPSGKKRFFFYARPNNPRNLFYIGIEVIAEAVVRNVLDLDQWDIFLVGKDIPPVELEGGYKPTMYQMLSWSEYAAFVGTMDLGLSLMYTPHPSYPPLDLAASGAVVVTNRFGNKQDLTAYSSNMICAALDRESLVEALRLGVALATDLPRRSANHQANAIPTDWPLAFAETIQHLVQRS